MNPGQKWAAAAADWIDAFTICAAAKGKVDGYGDPHNEYKAALEAQTNAAVALGVATQALGPEGRTAQAKMLRVLALTAGVFR